MGHASRFSGNFGVYEDAGRAGKTSAHCQLELAFALGAQHIEHPVTRHAHHAANGVPVGRCQLGQAFFQTITHRNLVQQLAAVGALGFEPGLHLGRFHIFKIAVRVFDHHTVQGVLHRAHRGNRLQGRGCKSRHDAGRPSHRAQNKTKITHVSPQKIEWPDGATWVTCAGNKTLECTGSQTRHCVQPETDARRTSTCCVPLDLPPRGQR